MSKKQDTKPAADTDPQGRLDALVITEFSQGCAADGPCILKNWQPMTPEEIVRTLSDQHYTIRVLMMALDSISSGFGENKYELENYAEQKLIEVEKRL